MVSIQKFTVTLSLYRSVVHRSIIIYDNGGMKYKGVRDIEPECWEYIQTLGQKLRRIREKRNLTLEECEELGYPRWRHLRDIEAGKKNLSLSTLLRISNLYQIKPTDLLKGIKFKQFQSGPEK